MGRSQDLELVQGTTHAYEIEFKEDNVATNITGWTVYMTVKENLSDVDGSAVLSKTVTTHSDPANGKSLIELTVDDTDITPGNYYYSIDYKTDDADEGIVITGRLKVEKPVLQTRS